MRKRVSVRRVISSSRSQKRPTLASSSGASTSSSTQIGAGFARNTAKISASAVSVCSPPDSSDSVASFLPGGWHMISSPASSGSSDSTSAIAKLRDGIDELNAEGRERLIAAFDIINDNFKALFEALFGGGQAELKLVESDDPLEAGLEIYACPPGKRLSVMSLMSGGEQALTAAALIFAVFLANPAPVCVLDEVDAPLDDANVDRFCRMLDEMRKRTDTRFIVITHNPVTMSRMDRLYGVTMPERGVSQLVSVDLSQAERMVAA